MLGFNQPKQLPPAETVVPAEALSEQLWNLLAHVVDLEDWIEKTQPWPSA